MKAAPILIRLGTAEDVDEVLVLERSVPEAPHWSRAEYEAMVRQGDGESGIRRCLLVAEIGGALAGFAVAKVVIAAEISELESIAILPSARRLGVGTRLCSAAMDWCRGQGAASMELEVRSASTGARGLYARLGFVGGGVRRAYYREPDDDAILMRLDLS